jgi:hypothetical protein
MSQVTDKRPRAILQSIAASAGNLFGGGETRFLGPDVQRGIGRAVVVVIHGLAFPDDDATVQLRTPAAVKDSFSRDKRGHASERRKTCTNSRL